MNKSLSFNVLSLVTFIALGAFGGAWCQEKGALAKLPYKPFYVLMDTEGIPEGVEYSVSIQVTAANKDVPPPDLKVHLVTADKKIPVTVSEKGEMKLPLDKSLADANAEIVTNQPKGSMSMGCGILFSGTQNFQQENLVYRDVFEPLHILNNRLQIVKMLTGKPFDEKLLSLEFEVKDGEREKRVITIHAKAGDIVYRPNKDGVITLPYSSRLYKENPKVDGFGPSGSASFKFKSGSDQGSLHPPKTD